MQRRKFLAVAGVLGSSTLGGCAQMLGFDSDSPSHYFSIYNATEEFHYVEIMIVSDDDDVLYDEELAYKPSTADESVTFPGTPAKVVLNGDAWLQRELTWNTDACKDASGSGKSGLEIHIEDTTANESKDPEWRFEWTCETIIPDD